MGLSRLKELTNNQNEIREWLKRINETDQKCINEVLENMNSVQGYCEFIVNYALK